MVFYKTEGRKIVRSWPGQGTTETIYQDEQGFTYRPISMADARQVESSTAGIVYWIKDGRVQP